MPTLRSGRERESLERTYRDIKRTCQLHTHQGALELSVPTRFKNNFEAHQLYCKGLLFFLWYAECMSGWIKFDFASCRVFTISHIVSHWLYCIVECWHNKLFMQSSDRESACLHDSHQLINQSPGTRAAEAGMIRLLMRECICSMSLSEWVLRLWLENISIYMFGNRAGI